jgi:GNAT superfamily N-acetyltransferase
MTMTEAPGNTVESATIREAGLDDLATIVEFNLCLARETEGKALDRATVTRAVEVLLQEPARGLFWMAEAGGRRIGQIMVTYEWSDWLNADFWWIQSVYVAPAARRRGIYRALHAHVEQEARRQGACGLRLYVERGNARAKQAYETMGMHHSHYDLFETSF